MHAARTVLVRVGVSVRVVGVGAHLPRDAGRVHAALPQDLVKLRVRLGLGSRL